MRRLPSVKTLGAVFNDNAKEARRVLEMRRSELEQVPVCAEHIARCYGTPDTATLRLMALDALADTCGVESFQTRRGGWVSYLNAGDTYATTLLYHNGTYRVGCWGDIAEREG
jgi:hypothetical protein